MLRAARGIGVLSVVILLVNSAGATPYWIAWEGNDYPENQGWTRYYGYGGAVRTLHDGVLTMDGMASTNVWDFVEMTLPGAFDPGPGETFVAQWRLHVHALTGYPWDADVGFFSEDSWGVGFVFGLASARSQAEPSFILPYEPGTMHAFELRSGDMRTYQLFMDDLLVHEGAWVHLVSSARVGWGDSVQGSASRSSWDYFRFGVVPEPSGLIVLSCCFALSARRNQR